MDLNSLVFSLNSKKSSTKLKWNFEKIFDANLFDVQSIFSDKKDFLSVKKSAPEFKTLRKKLRNSIDEMNVNFVKATNKQDKLQILQQIKLFVENFGGSDRLSDKTIKSLDELKNAK